MISKFGANECYVYIVPPGETKFVTAARFVLNTDRAGIPFGQLVYGRTYLARSDAVPIDPLGLPLDDRTYETRILKGVFGALRDASPDYWGRHVIEKHSGKTTLSEVDYLLHSPDDRAGALGFGLNTEPPAPLRKFNKTLDLERLKALADSIISEDDADRPAGEQAQQVEELLLLGTSMGGARPKAVVEHEGSLWLAKFNRSDDRWNHARVEHAMLELARECGVQSAVSRLVKVGDGDVLLVLRFDRQRKEGGYRRARMLSALTLLRAGDAPRDRDRWSYGLLAEELRRISSQPKADTPELFRRMAFNALISNVDDHPRNHAVIAVDTEFRLAPAYDLTPATPVSLERRDLAMICGDEGRFANAGNLLSQCARFLLTREDASRIMDDLERTVRNRWYEVARRSGVSEKDRQSISGAFAYEGFRLEHPQPVAT